ncbi:MAG: aminoglycoside phosphotransferase family protein [Chitinophagales bacterium]|nr:aminoglycoside phosphotransferase family protein [Chitinophagales bacterium]
MKRKLLNIFIESNGVKFLEVKPYELPDITFLWVEDFNHLDKTLKSLPDEAYILMWVHLEQKGGGLDPGGLKYSRALRNAYPNLKEVFYITAGDKIAHEALSDLDIIIGAYEIEEKVNAHKGQKVEEILAEKYIKVPGFSFWDNSDWRAKLLLELIPKEEMKIILGAMLGEEYEHFKLKALKAGYSGAHVIEVECQRYGKNKSFLLKLDRKPEEVSQEYLTARKKHFQNHNRTFVGAYPETFKKIKGWYCLLFPYIKNKATLNIYLKNGINNYNASSEAIREAAELSIVLQEEGNGFFSVSPFTGGEIPVNKSQIKYSGLYLSTHKKANILKVLENIPLEQLTEQYFWDCPAKEVRHYIKDFILHNEDARFKGHSIEAASGKNRCRVPLSFIHGDFHTKNILINPEGKDIRIIDFSNAPDSPNKHAFMDIGKLSVDLNVSVLPNELFFNDPHLLQKLGEYHKKWLIQMDFTFPETSVPELLTLYQWENTLRQLLIKHFSKELDEKEICRQFYMIRLHYFFKALSYKDGIREKMLFYIKACWDILHFLIQDHENY